MGRSHSASTISLTVGSVICAAYPVSLSCWVRLRNVSTTVGLGGIVDVGVGNHALISLLGNYPTAGKISGQVYNSGTSPAIANTFITSTLTLLANTWYHVLLSLGSGTGTIWVNGANNATNTWSGTPNAMTNTYALGVNGDLSHVAYWSAQLDAIEAAELFRGRDVRTFRPDSLLAYWPLNRSDRSETGRYDFVPANSPTWSDDPPQMMRRRRRRVGAVVAPASSSGSLLLLGVGT